MKPSSIIILLLSSLGVTAIDARTFQPSTSASLLSLPAKQINTDLSSAVNLIPRGGSLSVDVDVDVDEEIDEESSIIVRKLRNVIRSIVKTGEKKSPLVTKVLKVWLKCIEKVSGIELLPSKSSLSSLADEKKKRKKKRGTKSSSSSSSSNNKKKTDQKNDNDSTSKNKRKSKSSNKVKATKPPPKTSAAAQSHLSKNIKTSNPNYRIQRELKEFISSPPPNLSVKVGKNIRVWIITMKGTKGSLYEGERYRLRVQFPADYPTSPPSVYFLHPTPRHEHVYTNGDICLSLLGKDWRPTMTAQSIANSILSILAGATRKSLPMDNVGHSQNKPGGKQDDWIYHDDNC